MIKIEEILNDIREKREMVLTFMSQGQCDSYESYRSQCEKIKAYDDCLHIIVHHLG